MASHVAKTYFSITANFRRGTDSFPFGGSAWYLGNGWALTAGHVLNSSFINSKRVSKAADFTVFDFNGYASLLTAAVAPKPHSEAVGKASLTNVDSELFRYSGGQLTTANAGVAEFFNESDLNKLASLLPGATVERYGATTGWGVSGTISGAANGTFRFSAPADEGDSGGAYVLTYKGQSFVIGDQTAQPKGHQGVDGVVNLSKPAIGVDFNDSAFYAINDKIDSADPENDPTNLIVGVDKNLSNINGYHNAIGTARRDLFIGTTGNEAFYASAGDTVDVGSGKNFVVFNPKNDPNLVYNGNMTVEFGKTSSGARSGDTVVEVDTSVDDKYDYVLDLSSDSSINENNIELIAGGQSLYWYPGVPNNQIAEQSSDPTLNGQWLDNADVQFLSVIVPDPNGGGATSTITFVNQNEQVGIATTAHEGMFSEKGISPITTIKFADGVTWDATKIFEYIEKGEKNISGNGGIDFLQAYGTDKGKNINTDHQFDQYFTADPLNEHGQSTMSIVQPGPPTAPRLLAFSDSPSDIATTAQTALDMGDPDPSALYASGSGQTLDPAGNYSAIYGDGGGDTFIFNQGDGSVVIEEADAAASPDNVLELGAGITAAGTTVSANDAGDISLGFANGESVILAGELVSAGGATYGVQEVRFEDGTVWSYSDLIARLNTLSVNDSILYGDASGNLLDGRGASQTLEGFGGGDTFIFNRGYGELAIEERSATGSAANILRLGVGLTAANVTVTADSSGTITLDFGNGDQVQLADQLSSGGGTSFGVQQIQFADGTVWTEDDLVDRLDTVNANSTTLYGNNTGHSFDPGGIDDTIVSHGGGDTFSYKPGYGALTIDESDESANPDNVLQIGAGITAAGTTVTGNISGDLVLDFGNGDTITLAGALGSGDGTTHGVQTIRFADGTVWRFADIMAAADTPSATNTTLFAGFGSYVLDGQGIATTLVAAGGGDTFVYNPGYGALTISETDTSASPNNVLQIGAGLSASALTVTGDSNGNLILSFGNGDTITLTDGLMSADGVAYGVQKVLFADGTTFSRADLLSLAETASTTQTTLYGDTGVNVLDGKGIAHTLIGKGGNTTFVFDQGYGQLAIDATDVTAPSPDNVLQLGQGLTSANMAVTANANGDLILDFGNGDVVTIANALNGASATEYGVQHVDFADGSSLTYAQLLALADTPSGSNTTLYGDTGPNTLDGNGIAHTLVGNGGGDTFDYNQGYGALTIVESDPNFGDTNILQLGSGITVSNTSVSVDASGGLILNFGSGDVVTIQGALNASSNFMSGIQQVKFADGTNWTYSQMLTLADTGSANNTTLYGDGQGDTFNLDGFTRVINSVGGGDTINYSPGDGALTINEADASGAADNTLILGTGILESDTVVSAGANNDIILSFGGGDVVTLTSAMDRSGATAYGVQNIEFADGAIWSLASLRYQLAPTAAGMAIVDGDFAGTVNSDLLDGGGWASGSFDFTDSDAGDGHRVSVDSVSASGSVDPSFTTEELLGFLQTNVGSDVLGSGAGTIHWAFSGAGAFDYLQAGQSATLNYVVSVSDGQGGELKQNVSVTVTASQSAGGELTLYGSNVTINYGLGRGDLYVKDIAGIADPSNTLAFGAGITPSMITLKALTDPEATAGNLLDSLQLVVAGAGAVTLADALSDPTAGVQTVTFADGTIWTYAEMVAMIGIQHPQQYGAAVVVGGTSADVLDSQGTAHVAQGNGGGDTFVYNRGYGALDIIEIDQTSDINTLAFGAGITPADVAVTMSGIDQFKLSLGNGDVVTFEGSGGGSSSNSYWDSSAGISVSVANLYTGIERVTFADGTVWSIGQLIEQQSADASGTLYGTEGAGIFNPRGMASTIQSEGAGDRIIYNLGDGALAIDESPSSSNPENTLAFGAGITASMLTVTTDGTNFYISLGGGDEITINNENGGAAIQNLSFEDGTTLNYAGIVALTGQYCYTEGDGAVTINPSPAPSSGNSLQIYSNDGYLINDTPGSVNYTINANGDLSLKFLNQDKLTILHEFNSDGSISATGIQTVDGYSSSQLTSFWYEARHFDATSGRADLEGDGNGGIFDPKGFATEISDTGGNVDTIVYNRGYGPLTINALSTNYSNTIAFGPGISLSSLTFTANATGDLIVSTGGNDQITIKNGLLLGLPLDAGSIDYFAFSDGTSASSWKGIVSGSDGSTVGIDTSALSGTTLTGNATAEIFEGEGIVHKIVGGGGADQISYYEGDGHLIVNETDTSGVSSSVLYAYLQNLQFAANEAGGTSSPALGSVVGVTKNAAGDVTLYFGSGDAITLIGQLASSPGTALGVSNIVATDGSYNQVTWTNADIEAALAYEASTGVVPNFASTPLIAADTTATGDVTAQPGLLGAAGQDTASGRVNFTDTAGALLDTASLVSVGASGKTSGLPGAADLMSMLSLGEVKSTNDSLESYVEWTFSAPVGSFAWLSVGETVTLTYDAQITSQSGNPVDQSIKVTITGSNDAPAIVNSVTSSATSIVEQGPPSASTIDNATGTIVFSDSNLDDAHTATITGLNVSGATTGLPDNSQLLGYLSLGDVNDPSGATPGSVAWTFAAPDSLFNNLAAGESATLTYSVQIADDHGGTSSQNVVVTLTDAGSAGSGTSGTGGTTFDGGAGTEIFVFHAGFGQGAITNFVTSGPTHDTLQFDTSMFADWAHLLGATQQQGSDLLITMDANDSILLKSVSLSTFTSADARFV